MVFLCFPRRLGMLEFLRAAHARLSTICQQCRHWVQSATQTASDSAVEGEGEGGGCDGDGDGVKCAGVLRDLLMSVQRVMVRHRECAANTDENKG